MSNNKIFKDEKEKTEKNLVIKLEFNLIITC